MKTKILCIFDGFGLNVASPNNAISQAKMPNLRRLLKENFWTTLSADGESVGQEGGLVGNSEVGHMNIGGLKLVPQLSYQITKSSQYSFDLDKSLTPDQLFDPKNFLTNFWAKQLSEPASNSKVTDSAQANPKVIHLAGLFSTGAIHSDLRHWVGSVEASLKAGADKVVLHLMTDGRDSDKKSLVATWESFEKMLTESLDKAGVTNWQFKIYLGSVGGRFFGMDRDQNWPRVWQGMSVMFAPFALSQHNFDRQVSASEQKLTDLLSQKYKLDLPKLPTQSQETTSKFIKIDQANLVNDLSRLTDFLQQIADSNYQLEQFDEMIVPQRVVYENLEHGQNNLSMFETAGIEPGQVVWLVNFRSDRMKQFSTLLCDLNQEMELNLTILANNSFGIRLEKFLNADLEFDNTLNRFKQMPDYEYQEGQYYPVFKPQTVKNTLAQMISQRPQNSTVLESQETLRQLRQIQAQLTK